MKCYNGQSIKNCCVTYKIDGVQAIKFGNMWLSRANKPLYNLPYDVPNGFYEVYLGSWEDSVSACRTHHGREIDTQYLYRLDKIDDRLVVKSCIDVDKTSVDKFMDEAVKLGYEGLVLHCSDDVQLKVKTKETEDIKVTGIIEGAGKNKGKLGAFVTDKGNVGTGLTDKDRVEYFTPNVIGSTIEVEFMSLTPSGKFRHPRFKRFRFDK